MKRMRLAAGLAAIALITTVTASLAPAAPLDDLTCDQMKRDVVDLEKLGTRDNLAKGPAWGKANLRSAQLEQVKKLIEIEETIAFRCPRPKPPETQASAATKAKAVKAAPKVAAAPKTVEEAVLAKPAPKPRPKPPVAATDGAPQTAAAPPKPRPKPPAPKASDAYTAAPKAPAAQ